MIAKTAFDQPAKSSDAYVTFRRVRHADHADPLSIRVTLFANRTRQKVCGWYLGPLTDRKIPYLPRSKETVASLAVIRALAEAEALQAPLTVIDPDDLWERAWTGQP